MSEEEKRRCIILGICGGGAGAAAQDIQGQRRALLLEHIQGLGGSVGEAVLDGLLSLIDEALVAEKEE
jgi:hypothetical protein